MKHSPMDAHTAFHAATDEGNRSMRAAGQNIWSSLDYDAAKAGAERAEWCSLSTRWRRARRMVFALYPLASRWRDFPGHAYAGMCRALSRALLPRPGREWGD